MSPDAKPDPGPYVAAVDSYNPPQYVLGAEDGVGYERLTDGSWRRLHAIEAVMLHQRHEKPERPEPEPPLPSLADRLRWAKTADEIHANLVRLLAKLPASPKTKRKWRAAAGARLDELRLQALDAPE